MEELFRSIYEDLIDVTMESSAPFPVENIFAEGSRCDQLSTELYQKKIQICDRLHSPDDPDMERIYDDFWDIIEIACRTMFDYCIRHSEDLKNL